MNPIEKKHTPLPWKLVLGENIEGHKVVDDQGIIGPDGEDILDVSEWHSMTVEDGKLIVKAVNCHEELLAACREALDWVVATEVRDRLQKAIAKAESGAA